MSETSQSEWEKRWHNLSTRNYRICVLCTGAGAGHPLPEWLVDTIVREHNTYAQLVAALEEWVEWARECDRLFDDLSTDEGWRLCVSQARTALRAARGETAAGASAQRR